MISAHCKISPQNKSSGELILLRLSDVHQGEEQSKPAAPLCNTLTVIATLFFYKGSASIRHVAHSQLAIGHRYSNLNKKVRFLIRSAHLPPPRTRQADDFINSLFSDAATDGHAAPLTPSKVTRYWALDFVTTGKRLPCPQSGTILGNSKETDMPIT